MAEEAMTNVNIRQIIRVEIRQAFADEFGAQIKLIKDELGGRLLRMVEKLQTIANVRQTVDALEKSAEFTASQLEELQSTAIPKIEHNMKKIASALVMQTLDLDVHRRKWSLTIHGLNGDRGEDDSTTRRKCIELAKNFLGVDDADPRDITACHRLKQSENSGVIIRFCDLSQRNRWLAGVRNLLRHPGISNISDHLPCFTSINILQSKLIAPKNVTINNCTNNDVSLFKVALED